MRRRIIIAATLVLAGLALAAVGFAMRGKIREAYGAWRRGPIPQEVSRTDLPVNAAQEPVDEPQPSTEPEKTPDQPKEPVKPAPKPEPKPELPTSPTPHLPTSFNLKVAFISQAPHKIWDALHEDACEEAAMLMVDAYLKDIASYTPDQAEALIQKFVAYEESQGDGLSITAARSAELMRVHLGIKTARVVPIDSIDDIKVQIAAGRPVILPAAGKLLKNPNFKNGGPLYHMLVAKGYTETTIITNDPGTRLGANYAYDQDVLWNAIHDWNGGDVNNGAKVMIVAE